MNPAPFKKHLFSTAMPWVTLFSLTVMGCSKSSLSSTPRPASTAQPNPTDELMILWDKGYVIEEDEAIQSAIQEWQAETGLSTNLAFYNSGEIAPKTLRDSKAGTPPDILFAAKSVYPISDWQGKLADVTAVIAPVANRFRPEALQAAKLYGNKATSNHYYAVPLNQSVTPIHYRIDLLAAVGYTPADIPQEWDAFWQFWQTVQDKLQVQGKTVYAFGLPYSVAAKDSYHLFEQVLVAYDVKILDEQGNLQVDQPAVRAGIIQCLNWYVQFYHDGYVPPKATTWLDPDNNRNFLNSQVLMTPNPTLSIPAAVRNDADTYFNKIGTQPWPHRPDGQPLPHLIETRQAVVFADSQHQAAAKQFLSYLIRPEISSKFLKTSYGRFMPATDVLKTDPFWRDPTDPHIATATNIVLNGRTQSFNNALNPAYGVFLEENVWGQVLQKMAVDGLSAESAADEAITRIQQIFDEWS